MHTHMQEAEDIYKKMLEDNLASDKVTVMMIIDAHMRAHNTAVAVNWLHEGAERRIAPFASFIVSPLDS